MVHLVTGWNRGPTSSYILGVSKPQEDFKLAGHVIGTFLIPWMYQKYVNPLTA